jgi:hypothetical protein
MNWFVAEQRTARGYVMGKAGAVSDIRRWAGRHTVTLVLKLVGHRRVDVDDVNVERASGETRYRL